MYQSLLGLSRDDLDSLNQACCALPRLRVSSVPRCTYLVRGVVDNKVHDELHSLCVDSVPELVPVLEGAVSPVDISVV
jgi:hypothetical protein